MRSLTWGVGVAGVLKLFALMTRQAISRGGSQPGGRLEDAIARYRVAESRWSNPF